MKTYKFVAPLVLVAGAFAQQRGPAVVSPEVHPDHTVTFRLAAPKATEVGLTGDWFTGSQALSKDDAGVWSITVGPLEPSI